ncbi:triple tyrosine motif-containing protein [Chitinophaga qingshengii]|uniref:Transcriptional regulator n=1 Tax=Chitinophaga qingshengii TaxID=1569794 RepID=A0ABR7TNK7_9BACT|nr:triple tyrosine motif-containing protein [Chitinophaga qingshengii]MBC9930609.1 transcriptional regulator [Chitinophaga qingshengii]
MRIGCLLILLYLCTLTCAGQNTIGLPQIINYSKSDFKAGTQTWDIRQDSRGMMYFANNEGMLTYDGSHWNAYPLPNKTIVRALAMDKEDRVYAGGQDEIGYFERGTNGILRYTSLKKLLPKSQDRFADIWRIEIFGESVFFQASDRLMEFRNNSIKVYPTTSEWMYLHKAGNKLYAQDKANGLLQLVRHEWVPVPLRQPLNNILISGIMETGRNSLLITTQTDGLYLIKPDGEVQKQESRLPAGITVCTPINASELVAATTSEGCLVMDFSGRIVQKLSRTEGLQNNNVLSVFLDKDKNLWAGLNNGISFIAYNAAIKYISPSKTNEVSGYSARVFKGQLYIATSDGGYYVPLSGSGDLSFSKGDFARIPGNQHEVWRFDEVNGHLLMGRHVGCFEVKDRVDIPLAYGPGTWLFKPMSSVYPSTEVLAGTYAGVRMLAYEQGRFTDKGMIPGLQESIRFLEIDNNNVIWASHPYRGVYQLQLSPDRKTLSYRLFTDSAGLPSALNNFVFKVKNRVVFGTAKGIYEFDATAGRFVPSAFLQPVFGHMDIRYLNEDGDGNLWFCSGKKVGVVDFRRPSGGKPFTITYIPELDGRILLGFENIYAYNKENIFIGSEKGMIHLNYEKYAGNQQQVRIMLGQVRVSGKSDSLIFGGYFKRTTAGYIQEDQEAPALPKSDNSFHFEYSSPAYGLQNNIEYSYQLEGYDGRWSVWSPRPEKDYTNLPDGKYIFKVKARDNLGHESVELRYRFSVMPAWYKTVWAYGVYGLLLGGLLYLLYRWQQRNLAAQQRKFDEEQTRLKYIHQLELEKNEKEIIALQNEKLASEIRFKNSALADASLHLVEKEDALVKVKDILASAYKKNDNNPEIRNALLLLNDVEKNNASWEQFASHFDEINNNFLKKLKERFPVLTNTDLKLCAYLQLKLSSKEIAQLMAISVRGVEIKRYRLRKKLNLPTEQQMTDFFYTI